MHKLDALSPETKLLICMVGLPYSGKSTRAKAIIRELGEGVIVSPDAIRLALTGTRFFGPIEPFVWAWAKLMVRILFLTGHRFVILDACLGTRKRRDEWFSRDWKTEFLVMPSTHPNATVTVEAARQICIERATAAGDLDIIPIIEKMAAEWQPLDFDEPKLRDRIITYGTPID